MAMVMGSGSSREQGKINGEAGGACADVAGGAIGMRRRLETVCVTGIRSGWPHMRLQSNALQFHPPATAHSGRCVSA